jgi:acyl-CoA synthetase (NDP forming)
MNVVIPPTTSATPRWRVSLDSLLAPRRLALVGASPEAMITREIVGNLKQLGFPGTLYAVNPKYKEVLGHPCFATLADIPGPVDCIVLGVSKKMVFQMLEDCLKINVHSVVLPAAGFAESGNPEDLALQEKLVEFATRNEMRICGPNCEGNVSMHGQVATMYGPLPQGMRAGRLAVVAQSGGLLNAIIEHGHARGLGFSRLVSSGNEAVINLCDYIEYLLDDPETGVIATTIEGFKDGRRFLALARRALELGKPIVALKTGRSDKGGAAVASHTGSVAGSYETQAAVFRQFGVIAASSIDEVVETSSLLLKGRYPTQDGVCCLLISGGATVLSADVAARKGLSVPDPSPEIEAEILKMMPGVEHVANPFDAGVGFQAFLDPEFMTKCLNILVNDDRYGVYTIIGKRNGSSLLQRLVGQMEPVAARSGKAFASVSTISERVDTDSKLFRESGSIAFLQDIDQGLQAIRNLLDFSRSTHRRAAGPATRGDLPASVPDLLGASGRILTEREAKRVFTALGLATTREALATNPSEAARIAAEIGFPVAMKVESAGIPHKTEAGAIRLGVGSAAEAEAACTDVLRAAHAYRPDADIAGVLVQEMAPEGIEMIVGSTCDPQFGPIVMVGLGGIYVEVFRDVSLRKAPVSIDEAKEMIDELRCRPLLAGVRGAAAADVEALARAVAAVSELAAQHEDRIAEVDLNPVRVYPAGSGIRILDALIRNH